MEKKEYVSLRIPSDLRDEYEKLSVLFAMREGKRITLAHVLREALQRGKPILEQELAEPVIPGVSFVSQKPTQLKHLSGLAMRALEIGLAQINSSSSSQPT